MAKSRPTIMKRQRELARAEKRRDKAARRAETASSQSGSGPAPEGADADYDPDIAHIVAGPQPIPWADEYPEEEEEEEEEGAE